MEEISICDPNALYLPGQFRIHVLPVIAACPSAWHSSHFGIGFAKGGGALILANAAASGAAPSEIPPPGETSFCQPRSRCFAVCPGRQQRHAVCLVAAITQCFNDLLR